MKIIAYITFIVSLALIPISVLADPGIIVTYPDSYQSCQPTDTVTVDGVPTGYHVNYAISFDENTWVGGGDLFGSSVAIPIPYPDSSTWNNYRITVKVIIQIVQDGTQNLKEIHKVSWTVTCEPPPVIEVTKTADPVEVVEPGGVVTFTVVVENQSSPLDPVTITSLVDDIHGNLNGQGTCAVPQTIPPSGSYTCAFTATVSGSAGYSERDTVTASGTDDEDTPVSDSDDATVRVIPLYKYYLPVAFLGNSGCGLLSSFGVTVGFEDLTIEGLNDYDYNDWVADIHGVLNYTALPSCELERIDLTFTPQARGAAYNHAFHFLVPANTFPSNGTATLTIFNQDGATISSEQTALIASADNDFTIFARTTDVFPVLSNTSDRSPFIPPGRAAHLTIEFDTPGPFVIPGNSLVLPHGEGLFFDPYLYVIDWAGSIHRGDFRLLAVPEATYMWPEERRAIYDVYEGVQFVPGNPPILTFATNWWELPHNNCVYGDGITCNLP